MLYIKGYITQPDSIHILSYWCWPPDIPAQPSISVTPSSINSGDTVSLTCTSSSESTLSLTYEWLQDSTVRTETSQVLTFSSFDSSTDAGSYRCAAINSAVKSDYSTAVQVATAGKLSGIVLLTFYQCFSTFVIFPTSFYLTNMEYVWNAESFLSTWGIAEMPDI